MPKYTPWTWSIAHGRHYSYILADDGLTILDTLWSGPTGSSQLGPASDSAPPTRDKSTPRTSTETYPRTSQLTVQAPRDNSFPSYRANTASTAAISYNNLNDKVIAGESEDDKTKKEETEKITSASLQTAYPYYSLPNPASQTHQRNPTYNSTGQSQPTGYARSSIASLPVDVQANIGFLDRRFIQTGPDKNVAESLDIRFRRVSKHHHSAFFVLGRVFKMLWTEPAGQSNPGKTRNSTHFSTVWCGEQAYSEIRRFLVVRNKGTFSQCVPVQTYRGRGATKSGLVMSDHGVIHTSEMAPMLLPGEHLTKYSIRVQPTGNEELESSNRVNYGKAYAVEHNVKVLDIGMVVEGHRYLIESYFDAAMRGQ